jgi:hypothetical protein
MASVPSVVTDLSAPIDLSVEEVPTDTLVQTAVEAAEIVVIVVEKEPHLVVRNADHVLTVLTDHVQKELNSVNLANQEHPVHLVKSMPI